jgi:DtxR family Mn-dependent transcriptional regulator
MNKLSQSLEDYLETIYTQTTTKGCAKVTDIANALNVKKASVTGALNVLCEKGLINYAPYSAITLTNEGKTEAEKILLKHKVMTNFFKNVLYLNEEEATQNACKMEHIMSSEMFNRIHKLSHFLQNYAKENKEFHKKLENLF